MKEFSLPTRLYLCSTYIAGLTVMVWRIHQCACPNPWLLILLCALASFALMFKVQGATSRSHYTFNFIVYGFVFAFYGTAEAVFVIAVSNLVEWIWNRPSWSMQLFNAASDILLMQAAGLVNHWINPTTTLASGRAVLALMASLAAFDVLNHLAVGIVLWLARQENFARSGVFDFFPVMLDLALLYFGASLAFLWNYNYMALGLSLIPMYIIYRTLRIPALERQTKLDCKTGLFNDGYFREQFAHELHRAQRFDRPLAIIMADLDLLRNINNTYGHLAGDEVLVGVARLLQGSMREYDVVSRFGGEEFAILLPETTLQEAYAVAESMRRTIEAAEFAIGTCGQPVQATMSFGVACRERDAQTPDQIIQHADSALYQSKLSGRNRVYSYALDCPPAAVQDSQGAGSAGPFMIPVVSSEACPDELRIIMHS